MEIIFVYSVIRTIISPLIKTSNSLLATCEVVRWEGAVSVAWLRNL
ncbi:MAG: hypothetical protein QNJ41_08195 [Xenococcaceae cyanobacterium MO_188.B32]|nr:hypothetical protein [Xenococcaceae cyanobacterium MO_188.B32]